MTSAPRRVLRSFLGLTAQALCRDLGSHLMHLEVPGSMVLIWKSVDVDEFPSQSPVQGSNS